MHERRLSEAELELLSAHEAGDPSPDERADAVVLLGRSSEARAAWERLRALHAVAGGMLPVELPAQVRARIGAMLEREARSRNIRRQVWRGGALAVGVAALAVALALGSRPPGTAALSPAAELSVARPAPGVVRTGAGGFQLLPLGDRGGAGVAFLGEHSEIHLGPAGGADEAVRIRSGNARFVVRPRGEPFTVATPAADVVVLGTELDVAVTGAQGEVTEVRVIHGEVEMRNAGGRRRLWGGEVARARVGEAPRLMMPLKALVLRPAR